MLLAPIVDATALQGCQELQRPPHHGTLAAWGPGGSRVERGGGGITPPHLTQNCGPAFVRILSKSSRALKSEGHWVRSSLQTQVKAVRRYDDSCN